MAVTHYASSSVVTLPYDAIWRPLAWAKEFCPSYITNTMHDAKNNGSSEIHIDYFFRSETEALMFALKWK